MLEVQRSVTAVLGTDAVLPCHYRAQMGEKVVQVTWLKQGADGHSVELAVLHAEHGEHIQEPYKGRVLRQAQGALMDGAIVLKNAVQADEGTYECRLITFPLGNFEASLMLKVLGEWPSGLGRGHPHRDGCFWGVRAALMSGPSVPSHREGLGWVLCRESGGNGGVGVAEGVCGIKWGVKGWP